MQFESLISEFCSEIFSQFAGNVEKFEPALGTFFRKSIRGGRLPNGSRSPPYGTTAVGEKKWSSLSHVGTPVRRVANSSFVDFCRRTSTFVDCCGSDLLRDEPGSLKFTALFECVSLLGFSYLRLCSVAELISRLLDRYKSCWSVELNYELYILKYQTLRSLQRPFKNLTLIWTMKPA